MLSNTHLLMNARGQALRKARWAMRLTAREIAERITADGGKLSGATIYAYESGRILLKGKAAQMIAKAIGIDENVLLVELPPAIETVFPTAQGNRFSICLNITIGPHTVIKSWELYYDPSRDRIVVQAVSQAHPRNLSLVIGGKLIVAEKDRRNPFVAYVPKAGALLQDAATSGEDYPVSIAVSEFLTADELKAIFGPPVQTGQPATVDPDKVLLGSGSLRSLKVVG